MKNLGLMLLLVCVFCFGFSHAVRCYKCEYTNAVPSYNPFCDVNFDANAAGAEASIVECAGVCAKRSGGIVGLIGVERLCELNQTLIDQCSNDCGSVPGLDIGGCEHCCTTDLCNSAGVVTFDLLLTVAILSVMALFKF